MTTDMPDPATLAGIDQTVAKYRDVVRQMAKSSSAHSGDCHAPACVGPVPSLFIKRIAALPPETAVMRLSLLLKVAIRMYGDQLRGDSHDHAH